MTPEDLRADIPALDRCVYLNTGASGPSPRRVIDAVDDFQRYHEFEAPAGEGMYPAGWGAFDDVRERVASFVSAAPEEVALTQSTADGINLLAGSLDWTPGDVVVRTDLEHPSGTLPWSRLRDVHGIEVRVLETEAGRLDLEDVERAVRGAKLVCLSSISWNYGTKLPVREVAEIAHDAGALVLVDAVQSFGQEPIDVEKWRVDFLAASGHKWPLGPWGSGVLYVRSSACHQVRPLRIGGHSVEDPQAEEYTFRAGAQRFDLSTMPAAIYRGLEEAIDTVEAVGFETITDRIERLTDRLKGGIPSDRLLSPETYESGLVTFRVDDPERFVDRLADDGIVIRTLPEPDAVRASVHAFNTAEDVDALLDHVRARS